MPNGEDPVIHALKIQMRQLEAEHAEFKQVIEGKPQLGWPGIVEKNKQFEIRQKEHEEMLEAFEEREKERTWQTGQNARFQKWAISGVLAILVPLAVNALSQLFGV